METYNIGRDFEEPIKIAEESVSVSHRHATIKVDGDEWTLEDNDSTNGTFVEIDGLFRRISRCRITPGTWIRLGEQGHRGHCFKARRIKKPNDYREDFEELNGIYQEWEETRMSFESKRKLAKFITPVLMVAGLIISFMPGIKDNGLFVRASFMLPGFVSPFVQELMSRGLETKMKRLQQQLICPKCRRALGKDDILNRKHPFCKAH